MRPFSICDIGCGHRNGVWQPLRIHRNMPFDARYLFTRVIPFMLRRIRVLYALRINDHECALLAASTVDADLANHIFLMPALAGSIPLRSPCLSTA